MIVISILSTNQSFRGFWCKFSSEIVKHTQPLVGKILRIKQDLRYHSGVDRRRRSNPPESDLIDFIKTIKVVFTKRTDVGNQR